MIRIAGESGGGSGSTTRGGGYGWGAGYARAGPAVGGAGGGAVRAGGAGGYGGAGSAATASVNVPAVSRATRATKGRDVRMSAKVRRNPDADRTPAGVLAPFPVSGLPARRDGRGVVIVRICVRVGRVVRTIIVGGVGGVRVQRHADRAADEHPRRRWPRRHEHEAREQH